MKAVIMALFLIAVTIAAGVGFYMWTEPILIFKQPCVAGMPYSSESMCKCPIPENMSAKQWDVQTTIDNKSYNYCLTGVNITKMDGS